MTGFSALAWDDLLRREGVTITASSARPAFPAPNVAAAQPSEVWRTATGTTSAYILADLGASRATAAVFAGNGNFSPSATWRIRISTADATGAAGNALDTGSVAMGFSAVARRTFRLIGPASGRYVRIDFSDASLDFLELGSLAVMGSVVRPTFGPSPDVGLLHRDFSIVRGGPDGQQRVRRGSRQEGIVIALPALTVTELVEAGLPLVRYAGVSDEIVLCLDPAATDVGTQTFYGLLEEVPDLRRFTARHAKTALRLWHRI